MTSPVHLVHRFYSEVWDNADEDVAREILAPGFRFRGSLGPEKSGVDGFIEYLRSVHAALEGFQCIVEDILSEGNAAAARMLFRGRHRDVLFGTPATGEMIQWAGAAFFESDGAQLTSLWVLGDVDSVKRQLGAAGTGVFS